MSEGTRALLTTVLDVERELEGLLESIVGAGGSHLQNHREFSESRQAHNDTLDILEKKKIDKWWETKRKTYPENCSHGDEVHWSRQHQVAGGKCTCLGNIWWQREPHVGSTDSGKAEPGVLEDPPETHQTPHHGHMGAGRGEIMRGRCREMSAHQTVMWLEQGKRNRGEKD